MGIHSSLVFGVVFFFIYCSANYPRKCVTVPGQRHYQCEIEVDAATLQQPRLKRPATAAVSIVNSLLVINGAYGCHTTVQFTYIPTYIQVYGRG